MKIKVQTDLTVPQTDASWHVETKYIVKYQPHPQNPFTHKKVGKKKNLNFYYIKKLKITINTKYPKF